MKSHLIQFVLTILAALLIVIVYLQLSSAQSNESISSDAQPVVPRAVSVCVVPNLVGQPRNTAEGILYGLGITPVLEIEQVVDGNKDGVVIAQLPLGGERIEPCTKAEVSLTIGVVVDVAQC